MHVQQCRNYTFFEEGPPDNLHKGKEEGRRGKGEEGGNGMTEREGELYQGESASWLQGGIDATW